MLEIQMSVYIWNKESKERIILVVSLLFSCPVMADSVCVCVRRWQFFYFLFCKCVYFNWRLIIYNIVVVFAIYSHESAMGVYVFPILTLLSHPSGPSQCTSPEHTVSCIEPVLAIYFTYDNICVSVLFSKSSHSRLLHRVQNSVLYICVSFAVSCRRSSLPSFKIPYVCINILYWCFSFWLTSLCIIGSSFIHLIRTDSNTFFLIAE